MGTIVGVEPSMNLLRTSYSNMGVLGEAARAQDFTLTFESNASITFLVQAATVPSIKREVVETVGPFGVRSIQQGRFMNEIEMAITFKENVTGYAFKFLMDWTTNKKYLLVTVKMVSESKEDGLSWDITDCWIELDGVDLSVEDAVPMKLSGTLHGSFFPVNE